MPQGERGVSGVFRLNNFGGVNRHFQAKRTKYSNFHIIETTAWIPAKFCTPINMLRGWSRNAANTSKIADGRRVLKSKSRDISAIT